MGVGLGVSVISSTGCCRRSYNSNVLMGIWLCAYNLGTYVCLTGEFVCVLWGKKLLRILGYQSVCVCAVDGECSGAVVCVWVLLVEFGVRFQVYAGYGE